MTFNNFQDFSDWFWDKSIWLPKVMTWKAAKANRSHTVESIGGLYLCIPLTIFLMVFRYTFERYVASPFVQWLGVKVKPPAKLIPNSTCEKVFKKTKKLKHEKAVELSEHLGWSVREVERWFRIRRMIGQPTILTKATENSWRLCFYLTATIYGTITLSKYECLFDLDRCFIDFKTHILHLDVYVYYIFEIAMYISLSITQFTDVKRKDFFQNLVHHLLTLVLLTYSYSSGYFHIGAIIVYVHDISDVFLEAAKIMHYAKLQRICDMCFVVFAIVFYISRLYIFPFWVIHASVFRHEHFIGSFFVYKIMLVFLLCLQLLHIYWAYCVGIIVYKALAGKGVTDSRSEGEEDSEPEQTNNHVIKNHDKNNHSTNNHPTKNNHTNNRPTNNHPRNGSFTLDSKKEA